MTRETMVRAAIPAGMIMLVGTWFWAAKGSASRAVPTASAEAVSVQVVLPVRQEISRQVSLAGSVEAFEQATLYAKTTGYLKDILVDIGDRVHKGEALAVLDVPEMLHEKKGAEAEVQRAQAGVANAQAEAERARAELELKKITYERLQSIRDQEADVIPQQQVDEARAQYNVAQATVRLADSRIKVAQGEAAKAEASHARLATLMQYARIVAPFDGVVTKRHVDPGALIQQASSQTNVQPLITLARMDKVRVFVDVNEAEVPFVKPGIPFSLTVDALPGKSFEGSVLRFATAIDPKTRTMRTEMDLPNPVGLLRPGMYGNVKLILERRPHALLVPAAALITEDHKTFVFTVAAGKARRVEVETGLDDGIHLEITQGLTGKEPVVTVGKSMVRDGTPVKAAETK